MIVSKIAQLKDKNITPDAFPVMAVEGVLEKLYKQSSGTGQYGAWQLQNGELKDDTGSIKVIFANNSQDPSAQNKRIKLGCTKTEHGWRGVIVEDVPEKKSKDGSKVYPAERILKVTSVANLSFEGGQSVSSGQSEARTATQDRQSYPQQKPSEIIRDVLACHDAVFSLVNDHYKDQTPEFRQSFIASVFIESNKQGACQHFIKRESAQPPEQPKETQEKTVDQNNLFPADWPEAIITSGSQKGKKLKDIPDDMVRALFEYYDNKSDNTPIAECVYQCCRDRNLLPPKEEDGMP